ncbi:aldehyde dehydrogenase family protein [Rhodococcus pseudokoreensis]|uniref:Aldehyde dehydrogenase family protein n=1 Tax=Rhodococcus pseudokoreensis TaxID=2811421 RepID=A0A974W8R7_9NOCA|nr:aldehyde dehydrogenase family protein [Rhodococcus pseudokoreensis]QSE92777.1 aldehyde dehydrogenase family protein [Rhodococcus pseudokoreensis]
MRDYLTFYIDGEWVKPAGNKYWDVVDPATERPSGRIALGDERDVDRAALAARRAFETYSKTSRDERLVLLRRILAEFERRSDDIAAAVSEEMGSPDWVSKEAQIMLPHQHLKIAIDNLATYEFELDRGLTLVRMEPIGVCGLITPWNWPASTVMTKVIPALAVGCTVVIKPSEYSPYSARILAEVMDAAGVPAGVFNLVFGDGPTVGAAMCRHPELDLISITGSTRAGAEVARNSADSVKRIHQELGGKSPNIILESADVEGAVGRGVKGLMFNTGQSCSAPSRMIAPLSQRDRVLAAARKSVEEVTVGAPRENAYTGPVVNENQWKRIQELIGAGIEEGATLVAGGAGKPDGCETGYFIKPTVFADATPTMRIVREEIFGPVLVIQFYEDTDDAIDLANDTEYGLAAYVQGGDIDEVRSVASRIRAGQVFLNGSGLDLIDFNAPFGGHKKSGNGREWGDFSFEAFLEPVALVGYTPPSAP